MNDFFKHYEKDNIRTIEIEGKETYFSDIEMIRDSFCGLVDAIKTINPFILESAQLLTNAIVLYEKGYFDAAFYSIRTAIELSTTFVYLYDMPKDIKEKEFSAWKASANFPMQGQMFQALREKGTTFNDMRQKMSVFFDAIRRDKDALHKFVHKQGFQHFYVMKNQITDNSFFEKQKRKFEYYLKKAITIVAVMRLAIDPFPILLLDEEIVYRCYDPMTEPYSEEFIEKYIRSETIEAYKQTEIYNNYVNDLLSREKRLQPTFDVTNNHYINIAEVDTILSQIHLLSWTDRCAVALAFAYPKLTKIYYQWGLWYFTNEKSKREDYSYCSSEFKALAEAEYKLNQPYKEVFISSFRIGTEDYFVEHNERLTPDDIVNLSQVTACLNKNAIAIEQEFKEVLSEIGLKL